MSFKPRDLLRLGFRPGPAIGVAVKLIPEAKKALGARVLERDLRALAQEPNAYKDHPHLALLAKAVIEQTAKQSKFVEREAPAPYQIWGEGLEKGAVDQMVNAARLPVAVSGALMPDAHQGYGLPIGGVLAVENAVIPYAVGVDIACRMRLSVFDVPASDLEKLRASLAKVLQRETKFGTGVEFKKPLQHDVLDEDWRVTPMTAEVFERARAQLGTSGSGNHFVEFGTLTLDKPDLGLAPGSYVALLSHSGSRGAGARIADHYSRLAMDRHPELPPELRRLAWLDMDTAGGQEYWAAMNLMGKYAAANHALIHQRVAKAAGFEPIASVENHHNFCIPASERVATPDGPVSIASLKAGDRVMAYDPEQGLVACKVKRARCSGRKPIYTVQTLHRKLRLTGNHPVLTLRDGSRAWVNAADLRLGDRIVCARSYFRRDEALPRGLARFIGAFLGDGWIRSDPRRRGYSFGLAIGEAGEGHTERYAELLKSLPIPEVEKGTWKNAPLRLKVSAPGAYGISGSHKGFYRFIQSLGLGMESTRRMVPAQAFPAPLSDKLELLAGYMDADGSIGNATRRDGSGLVRACNELLVRDLRELAISAGLGCTNIRRTRLVTNFGGTTCYCFNITPTSMKRLDLWHERKRQSVEQALVRGRNEGDLTLIEPAATFEEKLLKISVSPEGEVEEVYDIEVDHPSHSFICEGMVVHNCWLERHGGKDVYVHRKGATPAGPGVLGVIPGSMATPGYVVRGKGNEASLSSASHGAGRVMSRTAAREKFRWNHFKQQLEDAGVQLLSAGIDEAPGVYKDIQTVMNAQSDLVDVVARFDPKIVKMADAGEKPED